MGKRKRRDYECGFTETVIEAPKFAKLLALNTLRFTNRKTLTGEFVWGFDEGYIVTTNDPLTGNYKQPVNMHLQIGVAGDIGVVGTKSFRDRVAKFLKRNALSADFDGSTRRYV
jgi:hypothetical protein